MIRILFCSICSVCKERPVGKTRAVLIWKKLGLSKDGGIHLWSVHLRVGSFLEVCRQSFIV